MATNVEQFRRRVKPQYYDSASGTTIAIASVTEDALISLPAEVKRKAISYLKMLLDAERSQYSKDYNKLLTEISENQKQSTDLIVGELNSIIGKFKNFLDSLSQKLDSSTSPAKGGMQPLMNAMTRYLGQLVEIDQNEQFHGRYSTIMEAQFKKESTLDATRELRSWIRVLTQYP